MSRRINVTVQDLTWDDVVRISGEIAEASAALAVDTAVLTQEIDQVKAAHQDIQNTLASEISAKTEQLERWASAHPESFTDRRSIDLPRAIIGFRMGQPTVKLIKGASSSMAVEKLLQLPDGEQFVTVAKPQLNKPVIVAQRDTLQDEFRACGIKIVQEERFFIDPKAQQPAEAATAS